MWMVEVDEQPLALIQDYAIADWSPHHFDSLPPRSQGIDFYIGPANSLGLRGGDAGTGWARRSAALVGEISDERVALRAIARELNRSRTQYYEFCTGHADF